MATTGLILDDRFELHDTGPNHPECSARAQHITRTLRDQNIADRCTPLAFEPATLSAIEANHDRDYIDRVKKTCESGASSIDVIDSQVCTKSHDIARLAAGASIAAVDAVMARTVDNAFCAVRPPGHHAEQALSMGFCLFNNVAIAARHLRNNHNLERVLILDWDVHHGNGTQHSFESDPHVLFVSLHGHPGIVYPGTGYAEERGQGEGEGFTLNIPILPPGIDDTYRRAFDDVVLPRIDEFAPQFVLISAGFDAHRADPLAPLALETESYGWMTDAMTDVAQRHCENRLVSLLEGGYNLDALAQSTALHVKRLLHA